MDLIAYRKGLECGLRLGYWKHYREKGVCSSCGKYTKHLYWIAGMFICEKCLIWNEMEKYYKNGPIDGKP